MNELLLRWWNEERKSWSVIDDTDLCGYDDLCDFARWVNLNASQKSSVLPSIISESEANGVCSDCDGDRIYEEYGSTYPCETCNGTGKSI